MAKKLWKCQECGAGVCADDTDPDFQLLNYTYPCTVRQCAGNMVKRERDAAKGTVSTDARLLYQMLSGLGVPAERKCSPATLKKLMEGKKIKVAVLMPSPSKDRSLISGLVLEGGITLHFAASTKGATIYKVTR